MFCKPANRPAAITNIIAFAPVIGYASSQPSESGPVMTLFVVSATVLLFGAAFAVLFVRLISRVDASACTSEWLENFSLESYAPMQRLLDKQDFVFLAAQRGYRPEIAKRLLAERRKVFLSYLRNLVRDFNQLLALAR